jgi:hypothetical protein
MKQRYICARSVMQLHLTISAPNLIIRYFDPNPRIMFYFEVI